MLEYGSRGMVRARVWKYACIENSTGVATLDSHSRFCVAFSQCPFIENSNQHFSTQHSARGFFGLADKVGSAWRGFVPHTHKEAYASKHFVRRQESLSRFEAS